MQVKDKVKDLLERMPEDVSFEDVQYHLYVMEKIEKSIKRAETEGTIDHKEVTQKFESWLSE